MKAMESGKFEMRYASGEVVGERDCLSRVGTEAGGCCLNSL